MSERRRLGSTPLKRHGLHLYIIGLLLGAIGMLGWHRRHALEMTMGALSGVIGKIAHLPNSPSAAPRSALVFVFGPAECPASLARIDSLNQLDRDSLVVVRGLMIGNETIMPSWRDIAKVNGISFPVHLIDAESAGALGRRVKAEGTPFLIAIDSDGEVRLRD